MSSAQERTTPWLALAAVVSVVACGQRRAGTDERAAGSSASSAGKPAHVERSHGECTFEADVPEAMTESAQEGISFTLESESFWLQGFAGTTLHAEPSHPLDMFKGKYVDVYRGTDSGLPLAIVKSKDASSDPKDKHAISGSGSERPAGERTSGCAFLCDGLASREAEVVAFCKSVKITVAPPKAE